MAGRNESEDGCGSVGMRYVAAGASQRQHRVSAAVSQPYTGHLMNRLQLRIAIVTSVVCTITAGTPAAANLGWTADLGTTGIGVHVSVPIVPDNGIEARLGANYLRAYKFNKNTAQVAYDFKASLRTIDALVDWYPMRNGFRLTGGLVYDNNAVNGVGVPSRIRSFSFDNGSFSTMQVGKLIGRIDFNSVAPYLGIGWGIPNSGHGWSVSSDLGVMYQGSPRTSLAFGGCSLPGTGCTLIANALTPLLAAETKRVDNELRTYRFFPVLRIGLSYRF